ncbi:MAG: hypothetical protein KatS3mg087_0589 [Patescibacteria group bacterium]|nr:MAG: hypothetical protein KatS3mg087_0589 [Patescibacteria group bacterium]
MKRDRDKSNDNNYKYVVTYDNGTGYREHASSPQESEEKAWKDAKNFGGITPEHEYLDPKIEKIY